MKFISWNMPLSKTVRVLDNANGRELFYYGVSVGWVGLGFVVGRVRKCKCKLPGFDANKPAICPTCGKPHRR